MPLTCSSLGKVGNRNDIHFNGDEITMSAFLHYIINFMSSLLWYTKQLRQLLCPSLAL